jgi:excisionase family DNA binding protein
MRMLTTKQAGEILGITARRVVALIYNGRLPAQKVGRDWIIEEKDLEKIRNRRPGRPAKSPQARAVHPNGSDPDCPPVGKQSGRK